MKSRVCLISLLIIVFGFKVSSFEISQSQTERALEELDRALLKRDAYIDSRQSQISDLTDSLRRNGQPERLIFDIAEKYRAFNNDSALHYLSLGESLFKGAEQTPFTLRKVALMPLSGSLNQTIDLFNSIDLETLPDSLLPLYYDSGRQMYSYISTFPSINETLRRDFKGRQLQLQNELLKVLPKGSREYQYNLGEYFFEQGEVGKARALLEKVLENEPNNSNLRARSAHHLATIAKQEEDENAYIFYLCQSALADVYSATREVAALQELGAKLQGTGDVDRSYRYLTQALTNAVECGAPLRMIETARSLPIIERAKTRQLDNKENTILLFIVVLIFILIILALSLVLLRYEIKKMKDLQERLQKANQTREAYIGQFLNLCSIYMDKLNQFCKLANRKISSGQVDDLYRLTKSGKFIEEQSQEFYEVFDNAFLHLYPDFPTKVNELLRDDAKIELREGELLNTDLRILAFMRLGIEESSRIAQVLNYSVNTIYAYRNRTKARAIDRENFESQIMQITPVS